MQSLSLPPHHPLAGKGHAPFFLLPEHWGPNSLLLCQLQWNSEGRGKEGHPRNDISAHCCELEFSLFVFPEASAFQVWRFWPVSAQFLCNSTGDFPFP